VWSAILTCLSGHNVVDMVCINAHFIYLQSGRGRGTRSGHALGMHPLMASVGGYQQMAAARWYAGMGQQQQLERRSMS